MPNNVENLVTILGPNKLVIKKFLRGTKPKTGDVSKKVKEEQVEIFCFNKILPLPHRYSRVPYSTMQGECGPDIEYNTWGLKWGAYNVKCISTKPNLTYSFTTAWVSPNKILTRLSKIFPDNKIIHSVSDEGDGIPRRFTYLNGICKELPVELTEKTAMNLALLTHEELVDDTK